MTGGPILPKSCLRSYRPSVIRPRTELSCRHSVHLIPQPEASVALQIRVAQGARKLAKLWVPTRAHRAFPQPASYPTSLSHHCPCRNLFRG